MAKLRVLLASLIQQEPLSARYLDHPLRGTFKGYREAHIEPNWLFDLPRQKRRIELGPYRLPF